MCQDMGAFDAKYMIYFFETYVEEIYMRHTIQAWHAWAQFAKLSCRSV